MLRDSDGAQVASQQSLVFRQTSISIAIAQIGERLGRSKGTISRELSRNVSSTMEYKPHLAQRYYAKRRQASKEPYRLENDASLRKYVKGKLRKYWSPRRR